MKTIWKWTLNSVETKIAMPKGAKVLAVQVQNGMPQLWALVDPIVVDDETRVFTVYGTGHKMSDDHGTYIGTFQLENGSLVFHVFEK